MDIKLYRCFSADQRVSMQVYADQLEGGLNSPLLRVTSYQPASKWERYSRSSTVMRYLRYVDYPRSIGGVKADLHHVTDHGYAHLLPKLGSGRTVVTVHDLIPLLAYKGLIDSTIGRHRPRLSEYSLSFIKDFDHVVVPSQNTANDLQQYLKIPSHKISVIAPMIGHVFSPKSAAMVEKFGSRYGLKDDAYWVLLSGQEFYKNHQTSLKVIRRLRSQGMNIRILKIGVCTAEFNAQVAEHKLSSCVHQLFLKDSAEVAEAYSFVDCLLFPSFYEGFGMPVLEALACQTRVVTSNRGSLSEVAGGLVPCVDPNAIDSLTDALATQLQLSQTDSKSFCRKAEELTNKYRPAAIAPIWHQLYTRILA